MESFDFDKWDQDLENGMNNPQLLSQLSDQINEALKNIPGNANLLWRYARVTFGQACFCKRDGNSVQELALLRKALDLSKNAVECDPQCFEGHSFYCICLGSLAEFVSIKERIRYGHQIKKHSEIAFSLNSTSKFSYHLYTTYGIFCYRIATMSWVEKKLATGIFGALPVVTLEDGLTSLMKGLEVKNYITYYLWISKILIAQKKYDQANEWMDKGMGVECKGPHDDITREELIQLKKKYRIK